MVLSFWMYWWYRWISLACIFKEAAASNNNAPAGLLRWKRRRKNNMLSPLAQASSKISCVYARADNIQSIQITRWLEELDILKDIPGGHAAHVPRHARSAWPVTRVRNSAVAALLGLNKRRQHLALSIYRVVGVRFLICFLFLFLFIFKSKCILNHFEFWSKPDITINQMRRHVCSNISTTA
jgi:hypothetical protein